ncbi:MAG: hypothetical protein ACLPYH_18525, partial [Mycobacterium sp.]
MGNVFAASMDFLYRPVSYTPARTKVDSDDVVRLVIAHDDPGVHNWLDTQGFSNGNLTYRNLMSQNPASFRTRLVKRSELLDALPSDTTLVSEGERVKQMLDRYHSIKLRYGI